MLPASDDDDRIFHTLKKSSATEQQHSEGRGEMKFVCAFDATSVQRVEPHPEVER